jgi:hypothetical protein
MNCREWEARIAADLDDPGVVRHVGDCAGCQVFASGLRETLDTLRMAHAEPIAPAHYAAVRARVMAELHPRRRWGWLWVASGVAAVFFVVGWVGIQREMRVAELPLRVAVVVPPAPAAPVARSRRAPVVKRPVVARKAAPEEEIVVKVETGDPEVVIYWITETKGDELR